MGPLMSIDVHCTSLYHPMGRSVIVGQVEMTGGGISQLPLYDTAQADIDTLSSAVLRGKGMTPDTRNWLDKRRYELRIYEIRAV